MLELIRVAKALTDENRLKMLKLLTERDICVCEMSEIFPLSHSQISRSLKVLLDAGLLKRWHEGKCVVYIANKNNGNKYCRTLLDLVANSFDNDKSIHKLKKKLQIVIANKTREKRK